MGARQALEPFAGKRMRFQGTFVRYGWKRSFRGADKRTILLRDIMELQSNRFVTDHLWFVMTKGFERAGEMQAGDKVEFDARVWTYQKGYRGHDDLARLLNPISTDYKLSHPTKIVLVKRQGESDPPQP